MTIILGGSSGGTGSVADGVVTSADGTLDLLSKFTGLDAHLAHGDPDVLLVVNPDTEQSALRDGATLYTNSLEFFALASTDRASLVAGPLLRKAVQPVASRGVGAWPITGCIGNDGFTFQFKVKPVGQSLLDTGTGASLALTLASLRASLNGLAVSKTNAVGNASFSLLATLSNDERALLGGGSLGSATATVSGLDDGDFPIDAWTTVTVVWDGTQIRLIVGDNAASAVASYTGPVLSRPWDGDPMWSAGLFIGAASVTVNASDVDVAYADHALYRWPRTYDQQSQQKGPTLAIAPQTTQGTFYRGCAGVVGHYTGWARNEADEVAYAALRDRQVAMLEAAGCPLVRVAEFSERAVPTIDGTSPGAIVGIDFDGWDAHLNRWAGVGCDVTMHVGYVPVAFGGGVDGEDQPTVAGLSQAEVNALYADYASQCIGRAKTILGASKIKAIAFWNEPENFGPASWDAGVFADLFAACHVAIEADHPDLPRLGTPDSSSSGDDLWIEVVDRAEADELVLGSDHIHAYGNSVTVSQEQLDDHLSYLEAAAFGATPQFVTEWNYRVNYPQLSPRLQQLEMRPMTEFNAAYVHAMVEMMIRRGVRGGAFFRLGMQATISPGDPGEESNGLFSNTAEGRPAPAWCAFELLWKHGATKLSASSNYPNWGVLASAHDDGRIVVTYHHRTLNRAMALRAAAIEWGDLPTEFRWRHWIVDAQTNGMGRPLLLATGTQADLPSSVLPRSVMSVGCIEITP